MIDRALFALEGIRGALAALVALAVARALLVVGQAWSLASAIVHLWEGAPLPDQAPLIVLFFLCFVGGQLVRYAQDSYLDRYAYARIDALRRELLQAVFGQGARIVQAQGTGSVTAMVLEGIDQVETYLRLILPKIVCVVVVPLIVLFVRVPGGLGVGFHHAGHVPGHRVLHGADRRDGEGGRVAAARGVPAAVEPFHRLDARHRHAQAFRPRQAARAAHLRGERALPRGNG